MSYLSLIAGVGFGVIVWWVYKVIYSLFFSPLKHIPGPLVFQVFPFYRLILKLQGVLELKEFEYHRQYGHTIRSGWDMVLFASGEAHREIYGTYSYAKGPVYDPMLVAGETMFSTNNKKFHLKRKRIIMPSFNLKNIVSMESRIYKDGVSALMDVLRRHSREKTTADLHGLFSSMSLDIIGAVSFGKSFNTLQAGHHPISKWISEFMFYYILQTFAPFLQRFSNPGLVKIIKFSLGAVEEAKNLDAKNNLMSFLIHFGDPDTGEKLTESDIAEEAFSQVIAGSESTASALVWIFYLLLKNPKAYAKVSEEIESRFTNRGDTIILKDCTERNLPYMNAMIKEAMRVITISANVLDRVVPPGGRVIDGYYIPEGTIVGTSPIAMHTLPSLWGPDSLEFKPERWLRKEKNLNNEEAFTGSGNFSPFSVGPRACIGRHLAVSELQLTVAALVQNFEFSLIAKDQVLTPNSVVFTKPKEECFMVNVFEKKVAQVTDAAKKTF